MTWFLVFMALAIGLKNKEQEWIGFSIAVALPVAGIIGGICGGNSKIFNYSFWIIFIFLLTLPQFENVYKRIYISIKNFIKGN